MKRKRKIVFLLAVLVLLNFSAWKAVWHLSQSFLKVIFLDVGQGDAIFIETPQKHQILIDGGPSSKILEKLGEAMPFYDRSLDLIILTHPDPDHLLGLIDVLRVYRVELIGYTGVKSNKADFLEWENQILEKKVSKIVLKKNQKILLGKEIFFEILAPLESFEGKEVSDFNSSSIVAKLNYLEDTFLFTGDIPKSIEKKLVEQGINLDSDILKVSHHGSKTSSSDIFLTVVTPEIAVIQVGEDNQYGHPHPEVLERMQGYGIKIFRTDKNGNIQIISDGSNFQIKTQK